MAAKLLHSLADDNPDLQKQIGCMTGIFQLFDRHPTLTAGRRLSHRRLSSPGNSHSNNGSSERETLNAYRWAAANEMNINKNLNEKHRSSMESARPSFSSSCSSMSSMDCNKPAQPEASSFDRIIFPETPSRDAVISQPSTSPHFGRQSLDLRDVVKDSMYREARGLSVKTTTKEEGIGHPMKHKDSPRPLQLSRSTDGSYGNGTKGKQNVNAPDLNESLRVLAKLREAPWYYNETRERPRSSHESKDGYPHMLSKDAHRFSCDGREMNRSSFESRDTIKSTLKLKETPRLSLDSRDISMRGSNSESKASYISKDLRNGGNSNEKACNVQSLGTQKRPSNVVAKLMGLEALPDSGSTSSSQSGVTKTFPVEHSDTFSAPAKAIDFNRPVWIQKSPRSLPKEPISPRWKNPDLIMKPVSRLPIEPAPWKQMDGSRASKKPVKLSAKMENPFPTVYSEIEKRLKDLEFNQSGKDLRALKQILEAMQTKGLLETRKEEQGSNFGSQRDYEPSCTSPGQKPRLLSQRNQPSNQVSGSSARGSDSLRTYESPIVIMKPAKLLEKSGIHASSVIPIDSLSSLHKIRSSGHADVKNRLDNNRTAKDPSPRISYRETAANSSDKKANVRIKTTQSFTRPQQLPKESTASSVKSSGSSVSPRLQQKKLELERRSRPPTPPSDSNKPRRQSNKMSNELNSPGGKNRLKSHKLPPSDDQLSQISNESRTSSQQGDDASLQSDSTAVFDSKTDMEIDSSEQPTELNSDHIPSMKAVNHKNSKSGVEEDRSSTEFVVDMPEHPSPISVLDASVYRDDELSPVKQIPSMPQDDANEDSKDQQSESEWHSVEKFLPSSVASGLTSEVSRKKLQNVENLVKKLRRLNSTHDEASTDYIASLCENTNPDHRYISEILLASGLLLRDLGSGMTTFQLHASGHPINPELFFVLEQTKASTLMSKQECSPGKNYRLKSNPERFHRKLIFDAVNEMIINKLALMRQSSEPWLKSGKLAKKTLSAQKLLKELCSEIEQLQAKRSECSIDDEEDDIKGILSDDVMRRSESWTDFHNELSGVVLDVERSIFKDLVDEIVIGEAASSRAKPGRRRQLFAK
ncbi:protein LONGIFOLIA 2 [Mercurialis annua]|uniref:protein LONGIFOLIA 2 n=1 Tax=Mercurialis annua TaxID=3986 RepID=UPI00215F6847|nr:protein LONGIFOLIA 2 [Mercurialis annua]